MNPYITTILYTTVTLLPNQMDNNVYNHLKQNLTKRLEGKCYRNYGYVSKIYEILEKSDGYIVPENPNAAATFNIKFSCKLCYPLEHKQITCKIDKITKILITLSNGPIKVIVTMDRINQVKFFQDKKTGNLMAHSEQKSTTVNPSDFVQLTVLSKQFNDTDDKIMAIGFIESMSTEEQIQRFYQSEYTEDTTVVDYDEYIAGKTIDDVGQL